MPKLLPWRKSSPPAVEERDSSFAVPFQSYVSELFKWNGVFYPMSGMQQTLRNDRQEIGSDYMGLASGGYRGNSVVFTCMVIRQMHFSEARFVFQQLRSGTPGTYFGTPDLAILEKPWPGGATGDLLARMINDVDLAGNAYVVRDRDRLARLRPDWVSIMLGSRDRRPDFVPGDPDTEVAGYLYTPGGPSSSEQPMRFLPEQVAHFAPITDPQAIYRGMSWLTPLIREVEADGMMTAHKAKFLENGATVNLVVQVPATTVDKFNDWVSNIKGEHDGYWNAYKTLYLGGGADAKAIGSDMQQLDFKAVQGAGETRIAAAARVPPVLAGFSEGLSGSALNAGNYQVARRNFADGCMRPLWKNACDSLATIINVPGGAFLTIDDRNIAFLREDLKDIASVMQEDASSIRTLVDAGFEPDAVVASVNSRDYSLLSGNHSGLYSVQLQPPQNETTQAESADPSTNGNGTLVPA